MRRVPGARRVTDAASLLGARRRLIPANGLTFEVFEAGAGDRLALLLHGFPQTALMWRGLVAPLVAQGYRVWAVNQRGYGASSRPKGAENYSLAALTGDVAALIDASGAQSTTLIGHDWGGMIAWVAAIRKIRPLERLVVVNIPHPLCFRAALRGWRQKLKSAYAAFFQIPLLPDRLLSAGGGYLTALLIRAAAGRAIPEPVMALYRENAAAPGAATAMLDWYRRAGRELMRADDLAAPIEIPVLVVWGTADAALGLACLEGADGFVPDLHIRLLPGVSHFSPEDAPEHVAAAVVEFTNRPLCRE